MGGVDGNNKEKMKYKIELNEQQYNHIAMCVEVCHRIACGQIDAIDQILPNKVDDNLLREIKHQAFPELAIREEYKWNGGYRGIEHGEDFRKAFDTFQAQGYQIYRQMCYKRNIANGIDNVLSSPTLTTEKAKQPIIEVIKD